MGASSVGTLSVGGPLSVPGMILVYFNFQLKQEVVLSRLSLGVSLLWILYTRPFFVELLKTYSLENTHTLILTHTHTWRHSHTLILTPAPYVRVSGVGLVHGIFTGSTGQESLNFPLKGRMMKIFGFVDLRWLWCAEPLVGPGCTWSSSLSGSPAAVILVWGICISPWSSIDT